MARDRRDRDDDSDDDDRPRRAPRRPRDDDDFEEVARPRAKPAGDNTAVKVLAIVGVVLVALTLICSGVIFMVYRSVARGVNDAQQQAQQDMTRMAAEQQKVMNQELVKAGNDMQQRQAEAANSDKAKATAAVAAFMQEIKGGRAGAAYLMMSAEYRSQTTQAAFAELLRANATDLNRTFAPRADFFAPEAGTTYAFDISAGFKKTKVTAIKEDGKWVIDVFTVTGR